MPWTRGGFKRLLLGLALISPLAQAQTAGFELPFWATPQTSGDSRVIALHEAPGCPAPIAIARVARMPAADEVSLRADFALEIGAQGEALARWPLPANTIVIGLQGEALLVPWPQVGGRALRVAIRPDGQLSLAGEFDPASAAAQARPAPCPSTLKFKNAVCWRVRDAERQLERLLAYPRPCA